MVSFSNHALVMVSLSNHVRYFKSSRSSVNKTVKLFWVYMVLCADGKYYVGVTNDVERRVGQHNTGEIPNCYTFERRPVELVYATDFRDMNDAIRWEKQIKKWSHAKKAALARGDFEAIRRLARSRSGPGPHQAT